MVIQTLQERILELEAEFGKEEIPTRLRQFAHGKYSRDPHFSAVGKFGDSLGLIPVAFYRKSDGLLEDLGECGFSRDGHIDNYVGRVFQKYRNSMMLNETQFAAQVPTSTANINRYEHGVNLPKFFIFERISDKLGLEPMYLLKPPIARQLGQLELPFIAETPQMSL